MADTKIEWADRVWNPVTGCSKVSDGCRNCYAERMAKRLAGRCGYQKENPFGITDHPDRITEPLKWRKPSKIFVCSMGDLFHEDVDWHWIFDVFMMMAAAEQHTFILLTKRPENMLKFCRRISYIKTSELSHLDRPSCSFSHSPDHMLEPRPIPNVWLGVSVEDQAAADKRIPVLLQIPAAVRFVSIEPMLGSVDIGMSIATCNCCERWPSRWIRLRRPIGPDLPYLCQEKDLVADTGIYRAESNKHGALSVRTPGGLLGVKPAEFECLPKLDWVICGGESGPGARPMNPDWVRAVRDDCVAANVPFFFKQWGEWIPGEASSPPFWKFQNGDYLDGHIFPDDIDNPGPKWQFSYGDPCSDEIVFHRVGKKAAGRELDGKIWNQYPLPPSDNKTKPIPE